MYCRCMLTQAVFKHAEAVHESGQPVSGHAQAVTTVEGTPVHRLHTAVHNAVAMHSELTASHECSD